MQLFFAFIACSGASSPSLNQDVYEEKMAKVGFQVDWLKGLIWLAESLNQSETIWNLYKLAKKCEQWRLEADKQNENAKRYREERNKCKFFL